MSDLRLLGLAPAAFYISEWPEREVAAHASAIDNLPALSCTFLTIVATFQIATGGAVGSKGFLLFLEQSLESWIYPKRANNQTARLWPIGSIRDGRVPETPQL